MNRFKHLLSFVIVLAFVCSFLPSCGQESTYESMKYERELIGEEVAAGELSVDEMGRIILPPGKEYLSDGGPCYLVGFEHKYAVYFIEFGMIDAFSGYLYEIDITDDTICEKECTFHRLRNIEQIDDKWYKCSSEY